MFYSQVLNDVNEISYFRLWAVADKSQILCLENVHSKSNDVPQSGTVAGIRQRLNYEDMRNFPFEKF